MGKIYKCPVCGGKVHEVIGFAKYRCYACYQFFYIETYGRNVGKPVYKPTIVLEEWPENYEIARHDS